jgi:hypothetical protein
MLLPTHIVAGGLAIILGAVALLASKEATLHACVVYNVHPSMSVVRAQGLLRIAMAPLNVAHQ